MQRCVDAEEDGGQALPENAGSPPAAMRLGNEADGCSCHITHGDGAGCAFYESVR